MNSSRFSRYQLFVVALLAFLQFTIILDFMILSPLGALLMPQLEITPAQFGLVVSAYAFSAGASGLLAAGFADRFDRKRLLLFFYGGFMLGTLFCGLAPNYPLLLGARIVTGLFGGVIGSIVFAITTDLFPLSMRGRVMGALQSSFAASQVLGIPLGLYLANHWGWHAPFLLLVGVSALAGAVIVVYLRPIDGHLRLQRSSHSPLRHLGATLSQRRYLISFGATALLSVGGFMLMPFASAYMVNNLMLPVENLPMVYIVTGATVLFAGPLIGRASDRLGKFRVFCFGAAMTIAMVMTYTHLGPTSLQVVVLVNVLLYVGIFSRMIPATALTSAIPSPEDRGAFMAIGASIQQVSGGIASVVAGLIVVQRTDGVLDHFNTVGYVVSASTVFTVGMMHWINRIVRAEAAAASSALAAQPGAPGGVSRSGEATVATIEAPT